LIYHLVFLAKYRRVVFDETVDEVLRDICLDIEKRYQNKFLEIGTDQDHVHFLVQSVPTYNITKVVTMTKNPQSVKCSGVALRSSNNSGAENSGQTATLPEQPGTMETRTRLVTMCNHWGSNTRNYMNIGNSFFLV
jgi:REP element-mobilizing transposase RayT